MKALTLLSPSDHTILFNPRKKLIIWIPNSQTFSADLQQLKDNHVISVKSLVVIPLMNVYQLKERILKKATEGDSVLLLNEKKRYLTYSLMTLQWSPSGKGFFTAPCTWSFKGKHCDNIIKTREKRKFQGRLFSVTYPNSIEDAPKRFIFQILNTLAKYYDFTYVVQEPLGETYGFRDSNGTWKGIVGQLVRKERDIGLALLSWTLERENAIDYVKCISVDDVTFISKRASAERPFGTLLFLFKIEIWILYFFCGIVAGIAISLTNWFEYSKMKRDIKTTITQSWKINVWWLVLRTGMLQGSPSTPKRNVTRIILASWWLVCIVILCLYSGNILAFLSIKKIESPLDNMKQVLMKPTLGILAIPGSPTFNFMSTTNVTTFRDVWKRNKQSKIDSRLQNDEYLEKVKQGHILVGLRHWLNLISNPKDKEKQTCSIFHIASENILLDFQSFGLHKGSFLTYPLSEGVDWLRRMGLIDFWNRKFLQSTETHLTGYCAGTNKQLPLFVEDFGMAFVLLLCGYLLGTITLCFESGLSYYNKQRLT
ncbi:glutamate receptor ionotropic, delta-2-like [Tachypleus tridentatus]|uniref:glutamate receptor ionotropic, delta-2-like n=1 Tax=Tachypleus tridentatus TaxID=6853 RepID=UPI003FD1716E